MKVKEKKDPLAFFFPPPLFCVSSVSSFLQQKVPGEYEISVNNVNLLKQVLKKGCGRVGVSLHLPRLPGCFRLTDLLRHGGRSPRHPTETLSPPGVRGSSRASSTSWSGSRHVGLSVALHPTLPQGEQTRPRADYGGHRRPLQASPGGAARAWLHGEEFEGRVPLPPSPFPNAPLPRAACEGNALPACLREGSVTHARLASPPDAWDPRRKPGRKHLPAPRLSTRPRPPPSRASGLLRTSTGARFRYDSAR